MYVGVGMVYVLTNKNIIIFAECAKSLFYDEWPSLKDYHSRSSRAGAETGEVTKRAARADGRSRGSAYSFYHARA